MPRVPPRSLCLPELIADPQTKADYIQANPPRYGPNSRPASTYEEGCIPPSPSSMYGSDYNRNSQATSFGLPSPPSTASLTSTHTSLSIHNRISSSSMVDSKRSSTTSQSSNKEKRSSQAWSISNIAFGGDPITNVVSKPRATWSNAFKTKSWFGSVAAAASEAKQENESVRNDPVCQVQIKLSPSMIAAAAEKQVSQSSRPFSSPYPLGNTTRSPRIGVGLKYYTEKNPAPPDVRKQIPGLIDLSDSERSTTIPTMTNPRPPEKSVSPTLSGHLKNPLPGIKISFGGT